jgi:hypothetical protein
MKSLRAVILIALLLNLLAAKASQKKSIVDLTRKGRFDKESKVAMLGPKPQKQSSQRGGPQTNLSVSQDRPQVSKMFADDSDDMGDSVKTCAGGVCHADSFDI